MRNSASIPGAFRRAGDFFCFTATWENYGKKWKIARGVLKFKMNVFEKFSDDVMADGIKLGS